jgi:hypothetical protein
LARPEPAVPVWMATAPLRTGYPMIDNMLTLLQANSHVYVDVAGLIWSDPIREVNRYIERLVDAGFEHRGIRNRPTDRPKLMAYSISIIRTPIT